MPKRPRKVPKATSVSPDGPVTASSDTVPRILAQVAEKGLYAIALFVPLAFFPEVVWPFDVTRVTVLRILTVLVLAAFLGRALAARRFTYVRPPLLLVVPILAYVLIYGISTAFSISPVLSLFGVEGKDFGFISLVNMVVLFLLTFSVLTERAQLLRGLKLFVLSASIVALLGLYEFYDEIDAAHFRAILALSILTTVLLAGFILLRSRSGSNPDGRHYAAFAASLAVTVLLLLDATTEHHLLYDRLDGIDRFIPTTQADRGWFTVHTEMQGGRVGSTFGNPDFLISFLVLSITVTLGMVLQRRWLYAVPLLLMGLCLALAIPTVLGGYKTDFLVGVLVVLFLVGGTRLSRKYLPHYVLAGLLTVVCLFSLNAYGVREKAGDFADRHIGGPGSDRGQLMAIAWDTVQDHPVLGSGPNTFRDEFTRFETLEYAQAKPTRQTDKVHNSFVEALSTTGWFGVLAYGLVLLAFVFYFVRWLVRNRASPQGPFIAMILFALVFYVLQSLTVFHTTVPYAFAWLLLGLGVGLSLQGTDCVRIKSWHAGPRASYILVCLVLGTTVFAAVQAARPLSSNHYWYRGARAYESAQMGGSLGGAAEYYRKAIRKHAYEHAYLYDYGLLLADEANRTPDPERKTWACNESVRMMDRLVSLEPENAQWYLFRALARWECLQVLEAEVGEDLIDVVAADARQAVDLWPYYLQGNRFRARIETELGNLEQAIIADETALRIAPGSMSQLMRLGTNYALRGHQLLLEGSTDDAQEHYRAASSVLEVVVLAYQQSAVPENLQESFHLVVLRLEELLEVYPSDPGIHYLLGAAYEATGSVESAIEEYEAVLAIDPGHTGAREGLDRLG